MKLSVAICTYNGSAFLLEQLESIAKQTRQPDELVICDDCSTDSSAAIVRDFAARGSFPVRLIENSENLGSTKNFQQAISLCEGEIIVLGDQDDVWLPQKLERLEQSFMKSPNVGLTFSDAEVVDSSLQATGQRMWALIDFNEEQQGRIWRGDALHVLLPGWFVTGATAAFRTSFRDLILPIPVDLELIHDGWLGAVIASVADISLIPEPLILYRQHARQQVGAPDAPPNVNHSLGAALRRANPYPQQLAITKRLLERLSNQSTYAVAPAVLKMLSERIVHLQNRSSLPGKTFARFPPVIRELLSGRYHRFSKGTRSAIKDILKPS